MQSQEKKWIGHTKRMPHPLDLQPELRPSIKDFIVLIIQAILPRRRRGLRLLWTTLALFFCVWIFLDVFRLYGTLIKYKLKNNLYDLGLMSCGKLRKEPILFVINSNHVQVVFETNCLISDEDVRVKWELVDDGIGSDSFGESEILSPKKIDDTHYVYKAIIGALVYTGRYTYSITGTTKYSTNIRKLSAYTFAWHVSPQKTFSPIRIGAIADNQFGLKIFSQIVHSITRYHQPIHYLIHAGDAVQDYPNLQQWQTDFYAPLNEHSLGQTAPMIYAHGNHDHDRFFKYIYTRHDTTHPARETWFAFSMAGNSIRWIILDSNEESLEQDRWLEQELASEEAQTAKFRVVIVHIPPFIEFWDPRPWFDNHESEWGRFVRDRFVPIFERGNVHVVISGHQHNYQRGSKNGIIYTIIGGAGGDLDFERVAQWGIYDVVVGKFHFVIMELAHDKDGLGLILKWEMWDLWGRKIDEFTLTSE